MYHFKFTCIMSNWQAVFYKAFFLWGRESDMVY